MKNIGVIVFLIICTFTVNAQSKKEIRKQEKAEKETALIEQTKQLVDSKTWKVDVNQMLPSQGQSRTLTTSYHVVLQDGKVDSYLPYMGRAHTAEYGGTDSPMIFNADIDNYSIEDGKKDSYIIEFNAKNKNDLLNFTFNVSTNGSVSISVNSSNRQHISYNGNLVPIGESTK